MPTISSFYSNLARQGFAKSFTHGYAQSVVAVTHPSSYPNQHNRTGFGRRPSRLSKLSVYQFQNGFHSSASTSSASNIPITDARIEKAAASHGGLDAYFQAWNDHRAAGIPEKEWKQYQFAKRIGWDAPATAVVDSVDSFPFKASRFTLDRSLSANAVDDLKKAENATTEKAALENVDAEIAKEIQAYFHADAVPVRAASPPADLTRSPALSITTTSVRSPSTLATTVSPTLESQSQSFAQYLTALAEEQRYAEIPTVFQSMLVGGITPSIESYTALLKAALHFPGIEQSQIVSKALDVYSDMLRRKVTPDTEIYETLISLVASRSLEISAMKRSLEEQRLRFGGVEERGKFMFPSSEIELDILSEEDRLDTAVKMFEVSTSASSDRYYSPKTYHRLISACAEANRMSDVVRLYDHLEAGRVTPMTATFPSMIRGFSASKDLRGAVEIYNEYKALAIEHDHGMIALDDRHDAVVYAAVVRAYIESDKAEGAVKFYNKLLSTCTVDAEFRNTIVSSGLVAGFVSQESFTEALSWAQSLTSQGKVVAMSCIATSAADKDMKSIAISAFGNLPVGSDLTTKAAMAMLAMSVRNRDVAAATEYWQSLSTSTAVTQAFIEPTTMFAIALVGSGRVAEGLTEADRMFERIKASNTNDSIGLADQVEEAFDFIAKYMSSHGIVDPRNLAEVSHLVMASPPVVLVPTVPAAYDNINNSYDPYAASTDFKGSAIIADELERIASSRARHSSLNDVMSKLHSIRRAGRHPRYVIYAKLITAAAREERMDIANGILAMAQADIPLQTQFAAVRYGWHSILDAMVGACLTLGNRVTAARYHQELLDMGFAPTANTFGLYITTLKESTKTFDEASEAMKIFQRAKSEGVEPSSFLYNALIGKLGKARRIDDCLFYFAEMRNLNIKPTSVTYGTIVNALCRVSDEKQAEEYFDEMETMTNYKARPAPYNSLMQFFLTTKRDKSKVLAYYERMKSKGIQPTNHTYKLLVDTHATLEPVNMSAAEAVLDMIRSTGQRPDVVHYASLIHAKGCVMHDLAGARSVFNSVLADPSIRPQACLYQALFESMVANHQVADSEPFLRQMSSRRVDMTAYIANTLIHGWANEKVIDKARFIFNTLGREKREPSTYEAMTRAYLAVEDRQSANRVVQEMLGRGYPSAVANKILELLGGGVGAAITSI